MQSTVNVSDLARYPALPDNCNNEAGFQVVAGTSSGAGGPYDTNVQLLSSGNERGGSETVLSVGKSWARDRSYQQPSTFSSTRVVERDK